ncbi:ThrRS/AlaRS common domain-containing protein [Polyporus arcularius HHB13444]|uniref:ThrRS/AlaRS common domain-containing protein n=1 Tax=Polyporus arcularius HHB13444 TaxID=1314778 RepID=A0A5C3P5Q3_9APHY|nr:ThrRS/AlaRS common domain-containing protein [Polyporus arcularius HHB13444]
MAAATATLSPPRATPPTYHRIVSTTLAVPTDPLQPVPVGLLACQRDPLLNELATTAVSCRESQSPTVPSNAREGKKKKAAQAPSAPLVEVILHDTIIFPEGGGQPSDVGILTSVDGELWDVVEAKRHGGHAVHYVRLKPEQSVDQALKVFSPGALVGVSLGEEGSKRRLDHASMHTSQHLLSAVLEHKLDIPTLAWSITSHPSPGYVEIPRGLSAEEIAFVQEECNKLVFEGRSVHVEVEELDAESHAYTGPSVGIPQDYTGGVKRTVVIDGIDRNPCCGTHAPTLHNLQLFVLPHTETLSRSTASSVRLYFLSGPRLLAHLTSSHTLLTATAGIMSCGAPSVPERVQQVVDERKKATKRVEDLEAELAASVATELAATAPKGSEGIVLHKHRTDDNTNALGFLSSITTAFSAKVKEGVPFLLVLSSSPSAQTGTSTTVVLIFGSDDKKVKVVGDEMKAKLNVKGGGKGSRWSGKFTGVWKETKEGEAVARILDSLQF